MPKKVIVIDDDRDLVKFLTTLLQDNGYETVTANTGAEALRSVRAARPDLITLDMSMPEKSGVKVFRELQADPGLATIPVVIVTGLSRDFEGFIKSRRQVTPPAGYIAKPITVDEVIEVLRGILVV